jgi:endonuclease YncB( thermonuclease family)
MRPLLVVIVVFLLLLVLYGPAQATGGNGATTACTVRYWADGDTVALRCGTKYPTVRLEAVNAGEVKTECMGREAKQLMGAHYPVGSTVWIRNENGGDLKDSYGRWLRALYKDANLTDNAEARLLQTGTAIVTALAQDHPRFEFYYAAMLEGYYARAGIWAGCELPYPATFGWVPWKAWLP